MDRRGQGTTEYLIILAVIIVIALVVVGVMGWFPGLGTGITESQSRAYWQSASPIAIKDWQIDSTNGVTLTLQNMTTDKIQFNYATLDGTQINYADANIPAGGTHTTVADSTVTCSSGTGYQYDVTVNYNVIGGIGGKTQTGSKPLVGTCP